ncbi:MAG: PEP-CTERM sorting domain-containing protein [Phycisphaerae bacterium]|nr:PEP-CTERM sorting domain-containing protein [Phycisphaerae bacterium]
MHDSSGKLLANCPMPTDTMRCYAGVAFGPNEDLYVAATETGRRGAGSPRLVRYDAADGYSSYDVMTLGGWREAGSIVVMVPEPATLVLLALGAGTPWRRR